MDIQTLFIGFAIFVISALLIWLITSLTIRERPFEERIEQQRQIERELTSLDSKKGSSSPGSKKDKIKKKPTKKTKASGNSDGLPAASTEIPEIKHVTSKESKTLELEIEPFVIESSLDEPPAVIGKQKSSKPTTTQANPAKPILTNKNDKIAVRRLEETPELFHYRSTPKDDLELKHDKDKLKLSTQQLVANSAINANKAPNNPVVKCAPEKQKDVVDKVRVVGPKSLEASNVGSTVNGVKSKKPSQKETDSSIEDVSVRSQADRVELAAPVVPAQEHSLKKKSKVKDNGVVNDPSSRVNVKDLIESLQKGSLSDNDARLLIDAITAKTPSVNDSKFTAYSADSSNKNQKDPLVALARQLEEKKRETEEEKLRTAAAFQKVIQQEKELEDLRMKMANLAKQNNDQLTSQRQDNAALGGRIKQQEATVVTMKNQMDNMKAQLSTTLNELQRVTAENLHLVAKTQQVSASDVLLEEMRQKVKIMDDALKSNAMVYNTCENAKKNLESKVKLLEDKIAHTEKSLRDSQIVAQHYSEAPDELRKAELRLKSLNSELEHQSSAFKHLEKDLASRQEELKLNENKLHDISRLKSELEGKLRLADTQAGELANTLKCRETEIQALTAQLNEVLGELKVVKEKPVTNDSCNGDESITKSNAQNLSTVPRALVAPETEDRTTKLLNDELTVIKQEHIKIESLLSEKENELAEMHQKLKRREQEFDDLRSQLNQKSEEFNLLQQKVKTSEKDHSKANEKDVALADLESRLHQKESDYKSLEERLQFLQADHAALQSSLREKEAEVSAKESSLNQRERESSDASQQLLAKDSEVTTLYAKISDLESLMLQKDGATNELQLRLSKSEKELSTVEAQLQQKVSEIGAVSSTVGKSTAQNQLLEDQLTAITTERNDLSSLVLTLKDELEMLRKAAVDVSLSKDDSDRHAQQVKDLQLNLNRFRQENESLKEEVQRLRSATTEAENAAKLDSMQRKNEVGDLRATLSSSRESENRLLKQIQHYKDVLSDTESILKRLQDTVEAEERKNLEKVQSLEIQLQSAKDELQTVLKDRKHITKTLEGFPDAETIAVDHAECMLRKDSSLGKKRHSLTELSGDNDGESSNSVSSNQ